MGKIRFSKRVSASELEPNAFSDLNPSNYNFVKGNSSDNTNSLTNSSDIADNLSVDTVNAKTNRDTQVSKKCKNSACRDVSKKKFNLFTKSKSNDYKSEVSSPEESSTGKKLHILEEVCI